MKFLKTFIFLIVIWVVSFVAIELLAGLFAGNNYFKADLITQETADESFGYFQPNQERRILFPGHDPYILTINAMGLRDTGAPDVDDYSKKILCIGDSFTFGLFVDDEASYPYLLQQAVADQGEIVYNVHNFSARLAEEVMLACFFGSSLEN